MTQKLEIEYEGLEIFAVWGGKRIASFYGGFGKGRTITLTMLHTDLAFEMSTLRYAGEKKALEALTSAAVRYDARRYRDNGVASMNASLMDANW